MLQPPDKEGWRKAAHWQAVRVIARDLAIAIAATVLINIVWGAL